MAVPLPPAGSGSAYASVEHPASGFALAGAAAVVQPDGSSSVAVTGIGAEPLLLDGDPAEALAAADVFGDRFAPREYRRHLAGVVVLRARVRERPSEGGRMTDVIGVARPRLDAPDKVTGATRYAADGYVHGLLHARLCPTESR